jgi:hypothetical protein
MHTFTLLTQCTLYWPNSHSLYWPNAHITDPMHTLLTQCTHSLYWPNAHITLCEGNTIELNTVRNSVLATKDAGAISFIDHTHEHNVSGNRIINNCVRSVLGVDTVGLHDPRPPRTHSGGPHSQLRFGWCSYGIYLDDHSSNFEVRGNALISTGGPALVVHGG